MLFCISSPLIWAPSSGAQTGIPASESLWIHHCQKQAEYNEQIHCIAKNADATLSRDLRVNNCKKTKFEKSWEISKNVIEELTAADDRSPTTSGDLVVNMVLAIFTVDLYEKCTKAYLENELPQNEIPSFSWFKFQFWPKDLMTHTTLIILGVTQ